jgi:hypothetical protein
MRSFSGTRAVTLVLLSVSVFPACLIAVMLLVDLITGSHVSDFLSYWAAATQFVHHANPYASIVCFVSSSQQGCQPVCPQC